MFDCTFVTNWVGKLTLLCGLLLLSNCRKVDLDGINNLNGNIIGVIGHGGGGYPSPEVNLPSNTGTGIFRAVEGYGADGVELDVQLSADSVLFLYHDSALESLTDCINCIQQKPASELDDCRYRSGFNTNIFSDEKLMRLRTVLDRFASRTPKPLIFLDIKTSLGCNPTFSNQTYSERVVRALQRIYHDYECQDWVIVETSNRFIAEALLVEDPSIKISFFRQLTDDNLNYAAGIGCYAIAFNNAPTGEADIQSAHAAGLRVAIVDVKIKSAALDAIEKSPDFIYTDNIPMLQYILK